MLPDKLETERLSLEKVTVEWRDDIFAANHGNVARYFLNFSDISVVHTWINECRQMFEKQERLTMVIVSKKSREFVGLASIFSLNIEPQFSIWIKESSQGAGHGKEVVKRLINWFKGEYGEDQKILYLAEQNNFISIKLALSSGMEKAGIRVSEQGKVFQELRI